MRKTLDDLDITLVGHPWASIGMGAQLRSFVSASRAAKIQVRVYDVFRYQKRTDSVVARLLSGLEVDLLPGGIRIFHVNADEVESVIRAIESRGGDFSAGYNIIVPAWELPRYPEEWLVHLKRFDDVWALSKFISSSLAASGLIAKYIGQSIELPVSHFMQPRSFFGLREDAFVFLSHFDHTSYATRKNPFAAIEFFSRLRHRHPSFKTQLVVKAKDGERPGKELGVPIDGEMVKFISTPLDTLETVSLINATDCILSFHRAEGFGRVPGEAMGVGKLAIATGWSGNLDYMTNANSLLVDYQLTDLKQGDYPHWEAQQWAEPDLSHALELFSEVIENEQQYAAIVDRAVIDVLTSHGDRAVGLRMLSLLEAIIGSQSRRPSS